MKTEEEIKALEAELAETRTKLAYAEDAAAKGEEGRNLGTAYEELLIAHTVTTALLSRTEAWLEQFQQQAASSYMNYSIWQQYGVELAQVVKAHNEANPTAQVIIPPELVRLSEVVSYPLKEYTWRCVVQILYTPPEDIGSAQLVRREGLPWATPGRAARQQVSQMGDTHGPCGARPYANRAPRRCRTSSRTHSSRSNQLTNMPKKRKPTKLDLLFQKRVQSPAGPASPAPSTPKPSPSVSTTPIAAPSVTSAPTGSQSPPGISSATTSSTSVKPTPGGPLPPKPSPSPKSAPSKPPAAPVTAGSASPTSDKPVQGQIVTPCVCVVCGYQATDVRPMRKHWEQNPETHTWPS
jgi:hypothetical protein